MEVAAARLSISLAGLAPKRRPGLQAPGVGVYGAPVDCRRFVDRARRILDEHSGSLERRDQATVAVLLAYRERLREAATVLTDLAQSSPTPEEGERWLMLAEELLA